MIMPIDRVSTFASNMARYQYRIACSLAAFWCLLSPVRADESASAGPLYSSFPLTLAPGRCTEVLGPLFYEQTGESQRQWGIPPLGLSSTVEPDVDAYGFDLLYPLLTYRRYGAEYRWQFLQFWSFAGGNSADTNGIRRFTLFPVYFQQRSPDPAEDYTALLPIYGELHDRLFRDKIDFVLLPLYVKSQKRDIVTRNMPYPFFHLREGDGLHGWQVWPLIGREHKEVTTHTNGFGDQEIVGGHDNTFALWPLFWDEKSELGTDHAGRLQALVPFYSYSRSRQRDSTSWLWPLGVTHTIDREQKYDEWDVPWPFIEFARGEGKTTRRVWPFFNRSNSKTQVDNWYLWPVYKYDRVTSAPLDRQRSRLLFFLYSAVAEKNTETGKTRRREDFFPFYTRERDFEGRERFQLFSPIEPFFPSNPSLKRDYSPLFALWRAENNPGTGAAGQSLLWNLWRRDTAPGRKKISLLFGLFQYQSTLEESRWRVFYLPGGRAQQAGAAPPPPR